VSLAVTQQSAFSSGNPSQHEPVADVSCLDNRERGKHLFGTVKDRLGELGVAYYFLVLLLLLALALSSSLSSLLTDQI
jgi:hypothetical protein